MKTNVLLIFLLLYMLLSGGTVVAQTADTISNAGTDVIDQQNARIEAIQTDLDFVWVILSAALVFFMQVGFMALEAGMARTKNSINVAIKNLTDFVLGVVGFWLVGFGIMFGTSHAGLFGTSDFLISLKDPWVAAFFLFQAVFVGTAATIDSGAVCERSKLKQYIFLSFLTSIFVYPVFGHWAWGSFLHGGDALSSGGAGWLEAMGFKDFAGSTVVHSVGAWMALAGVIVVGPRIGKFEIDSKTGRRGAARNFQPGDMRFVFLGVFILFFGWFGFNAGSTLSANPDIAGISLNTTLAAAFGCIFSSALSWIFHPEKKIDGVMIGNGVLAGLVAITAGCAYVDTYAAAIIGSVAGVIVYFGSLFIERVLKLDDVVGAVPVHGFAGVWGTIALGIFIRPEFLGNMTRLEQIQVQFLGVLVCFAWAFGLGLLLYKLVDRFFGGVRVSPEDELMGLNVAEHGAKSSLLELANAMDVLTRSGDFEHHPGVEVDYGTEVGDLADLFNKMIGKIQSAIGESRRQQNLAEEMLQDSLKQQERARKTREELDQTRTQAEEKRGVYINKAQAMVGQVIDKAGGIHARMTDTTQVTSSMYASSQQLTSTLTEMLASLSQAYARIKDVKTVTEAASANTLRARLDVSELKGITAEINSMVAIINDLAGQTHILSINSAIEAARAREQGAGFKVISNEVRDLSSQSSSTASQIIEQVRGVEDRVQNVMSSMEELTKIVDQISDLNQQLVQIIGQNEGFASIIGNQSRENLKAAEGLRTNIDSVMQDVVQVATIGKQVQVGLEDI